MNLQAVRKWFVQTSGRYDLVSSPTSFEDNGADNYIRAGQRYLDRALTQKKGLARSIDMLQVGQYLYVFKEMRSVYEVFLTRDQIGRWRLEKKDFDWIRAAFPNMDTLQPGAPYFYCPASLETITPPATGYDAFMNYIGDLLGDDPTEYNGILVMPPPDQKTMIEVFGYVYKKTLLVDADENFWTKEHPELLVMATQLVLEKFNRNTEGVKDWKLSIEDHIAELSKDMVEEEVADVDEMEGYTEDGFSRTRARRRNRGQVWYG